MVKWPKIPIPFEKIMRGHRLTNASERIYDFICQEQKNFVSQQKIVDDEQKRPIVVGLNDGGEEIAEILEGMYEEDSNAPYFSLLSVGPDKEAEWVLDGDIDKPNVDYNLDDRLVILVAEVINSGESVYLALKELYRDNRPKYVRLAVVGDNSEARNYPIQPDNKLSL